MMFICKTVTNTYRSRAKAPPRREAVPYDWLVEAKIHAQLEVWIETKAGHFNINLFLKQQYPNRYLRPAFWIEIVKGYGQNKNRTKAYEARKR
jgi:hypothetical protein